MSSSIPLNRVIDLVKNIIDGIRCPICDKSFGNRWRYPCGHVGCYDCLTATEGCALCLTPPTGAALAKVKITDVALTDRVNNANSLLYACQKTFNIDVYKQHRMSEQLKLEKKFFPECIQAPVKYCNKRKSLTAAGNKENTFKLPGEQISSPKQTKMKRYSASVKDWLNKNETFSRRVFSELNVNLQNSITNKKVNKNILSSRKRNHSLSPVKQLNKVPVTYKRGKKTFFEQHTYDKLKIEQKCEHEESGKVLNDEPIYIENTSSEEVDKDKLALLAVEQADDLQASDSLFLESLEQTQHANILNNNLHQAKPSFNNVKNSKVPFYKKGSLLNTCPYCETNNILDNTSVDSKNVSICIENSNFITTINISNYVENTQPKSSISIQTDICEFNESAKNIIKEKDGVINLLQTSERNEPHNEFEKENECDMDLFTEDCELKGCSELNIKEKVITPEPKELQKKNVVIDDSDSDTISEESSILYVSADVHVPYEPDDYRILSEIGIDQSMCKSRSKARGATPDSNNSSEKENCDPNKMKKRQGSNKIKSKKK